MTREQAFHVAFHAALLALHPVRVHAKRRVTPLTIRRAGEQLIMLRPWLDHVAGRGVVNVQ